MKKLSIIIPVYNERQTLERIVGAVEGSAAAGLAKEIIVVDDFSTDGTREILRNLAGQKRVKVFYQDRNLGKGAAVRLGFAKASGDYVIIQDADLEYDPNDFSKVLNPLLDGRADAVFSSRFLGIGPHRVLFFWHSVGNRVLTTLSNIFTNLNLTDIESCYKAFTREAILAILPELQSNRFGIEPELVARASAKRLRIYEVGISYHGRTYKEGKKISWKDGVAAIYFIVLFGLEELFRRLGR